MTASASGRVVTLQNTGAGWDIYRLSASGAELQNALIAIAPGGSARITVAGTTAASFTATSESDPSKTATVTIGR